MIIIIDAYNFIKYAAKFDHVAEQELTYWINTFNTYISLRKNDVVLVFDAGPEYQSSKEQCGNLLMLYSGQRQTADDIIKEWLRRHKNNDVLLVTSDREIRDFASSLQYVSISSDDFYKIFMHVMKREEKNEQKISSNIHKLAKNTTPELDRLMERGSRDLIVDDIEDNEIMPLRVRNGKKASMQNKRLMKKIEKI